MYFSNYLSSHSFTDHDFYHINVLKALVYLLPGPPRKKDEHGPHRIDKIVQYIEYSTNVMEKVKGVASKCKKLSPFLICATTNNVPVKYYLSVFEGISTFETFPGCFDILFQSFFALNLFYPTEVKSLYIFVQKFFYGINLEIDPALSAVVTLINSLDHNRLQ